MLQSRKSPNKNYFLRRLGTNKTQLIHQIRLIKFTPSAPLANNFVRETDWQKSGTIVVTHDDLYAHTWDTNFGINPFDTEIDSFDTDTQEYVPIKHPPSLEISKNSGGAPVEETTVSNEETLTENARNEIDAIDSQQNLQPNPTIDAEQSPENTNENQVTTLSEDNEEVQKNLYQYTW